MVRRWFLDHPKSVGETYGEHQRVALTYAGSLALAAMACFIHALIPSLFERFASQTITRLHDKMRARMNPHVTPAAGTPMPGAAIRVTRTHQSG